MVQSLNKATGISMVKLPHNFSYKGEQLYQSEKTTEQRKLFIKFEITTIYSKQMISKTEKAKNKLQDWLGLYLENGVGRYAERYKNLIMLIGTKYPVFRNY